MSILPAVIIGYDSGLRPCSVVCGMCGEQLFRWEPRSMSPDESFNWIVGLFEEHEAINGRHRPTVTRGYRYRRILE